ncbi:MAG: hypothetical protein QXN10_05945 [Desulfurococcaceae archaeon]
MVICAGLDLAGSKRRPTGVAIITMAFDIIDTRTLFRDEEIINYIIRNHVNTVAIDSPLDRPSCGSVFRKIDLVLIRNGFKVLPPGWIGMSMLVNRAIGISKALMAMGVEVLETHPRSSLKSSGCSSFEELIRALNLNINRELNKDEKDAIVSALVCVFHKLGKSRIYRAEDGQVVLLPPICQNT